MATQYYGLTGRKIKPDYVGIVNANVRNLAKKKELEDQKKYRAELLGLEERQINESNALAKDRIKAGERASTRASAIGVGQLGLSAYTGRQRDKKLQEILETSTGGGETAGGVAPEAAQSVSNDIEDIKFGATDTIKGVGDTAPSFFDKVKTGASNWGPIVTGSLVGGTVGAELGEKIIPFGGKTMKRVIGGGLTGGGLAYLASGDPYTAAITAVFGAGIGGIF